MKKDLLPTTNNKSEQPESPGDDKIQEHLDNILKIRDASIARFHSIINDIFVIAQTNIVANLDDTRRSIMDEHYRGWTTSDFRRLLKSLSEHDDEAKTAWEELETIRKQEEDKKARGLEDKHRREEALQANSKNVTKIIELYKQYEELANERIKKLKPEEERLKAQMSTEKEAFIKRLNQQLAVYLEKFNHGVKLDLSGSHTLQSFKEKLMSTPIKFFDLKKKKTLRLITEAEEQLAIMETKFNDKLGDLNRRKEDLERKYQAIEQALVDTKFLENHELAEDAFHKNGVILSWLRMMRKPKESRDY
jgi:DNA repair exonuclease SbcCD ATPase subunit